MTAMALKMVLVADLKHVRLLGDPVLRARALPVTRCGLRRGPGAYTLRF
jgi:hypothetical protein